MTFNWGNRDTLSCGKVNEPNKRGIVRYSVTNIKDLLDKIVPFFQNYPLHAKKQFDFQLWKEAVIIFKRNQRLTVNRKSGEKGFHKVNWNPKDLVRLKEIHNEMIKYKSSGKPWKWL